MMERKNMKKVKNILLGLMMVALFASCTREIPQPVGNFKIQIALPSNFSPSVKYANKEVILTSSTNEYKIMTDANGVAQIPAIIPDEYNITTSWEMTGAIYKTLIAEPELVEDKATILLSGTLNNQKIYNSNDINIALEKLVLKKLLISKVYYTGTKDNANKNYTTDAYIEIFNTSDEVVYIDGMYLALTESVSTPAYPAKDNPDYIYTRQICKFPGEGNTYPVEPGESIVVATRSARDHTASASTSVDLSSADFEVKETDGTGNPDVKALPVVSSSLSIKFFNMLSGGGNGVFIFETDEDIFSWPEFYAPGKTSGERFRRVPVSVVLDGVECLKNSAGTGPDVNLKRLPDIVDAGYSFVNATSGYTHESIERKVNRVIDGRVTLKDSNNSIQDFVISTDPTPKKYDKPELNN